MFIAFLAVVFFFGYERYSLHKTEQAKASVLILTPQVDDIYFLDLRKLNNQQDNKNKYNIAKIVRVTDEGVSLVYGRFFYQWQYSVINSIQYGDVANNNYFRLIPDYIPMIKIQEMRNNDAIYLVKRPVRNKLYGNFISP